MVVLLSILLGLIVIGGIEFVGSQGRTRHKFVQSPNGIGSTYTPTTARSRWIPPMDFVEVPGRPNFAARVIPESETNCDSFTSCWNVSVVSRNGCSYGIQVTMKVETPSGTIIDSASDSFVGEVGPEQVTLLKPENTSGQSQVTGEVTRVSCFLD